MLKWCNRYFVFILHTNTGNYKHEYTLHEYLLGMFRKFVGYWIFYYLFCMTILHIAGCV